jgi:mono/diheme cytochrome c family protein
MSAKTIFTTVFLTAALLYVLPIAAGGKDLSFSEIQHGKYLVDAGDCQDCHTQEKGKPFAGGRPVETPFGIIYSSNITPDRETGIGKWSGDDFYNAMHFGIAPDGAHLYPAFPYPYFTRMSRQDVDAIHAYLSTLEPAKNEKPGNKLTWPLGYRGLMRGWNWLYFDAGTFKPDPKKSAEWNRGAYLIEGPGHCGACHTSKNLFGADKDKSGYFKGGVLQNWLAPNLTNDTTGGIGSWNADDIVTYLKTGRNAKSGATGIMAEVVAYSTSHLNDNDLHAIAVYLKDLPGTQERPAPSQASASMLAAGKAIYDDSCSACHQSSGEGVPFMFPPLKGNANVQSADPTTVLRLILEGGRTVATDAEPTPSTMPAYDWKLNDDELAAVATYVRNTWGNAAPEVSAHQVGKLRKELKTTDR